MKETAVITGLGSICSLGIGVGDLYQAFRDGRTAFAKRPFPEAKPLPGLDPWFAASIGDVSVEELLGKKGLRTLNRESRIFLSAAALAARHAGLDLSAVEPERLGVFAATQFAGLDDYAALVADGMVYGADRVNPALGSQTGFNAPASQVAIRLNAQGPNMTMSSGAASALDVLDHTADHLIEDPDLVLLAGGLDLFSFFMVRALRERHANDRPPAPYDKDRAGPVCGEAGVMFVVESASGARCRGTRVLAELRGAGSAYTGGRLGTAPEDAAVAAFDQALDQAGIDADEIGAVMASANGDRDLDAAEATAIYRRFGNRVPVYAVKGAVGECFGAGAGLQVAAGLYTLETGSIPGTAGLRNFDPNLPPLRVSCHPYPVEQGPVLVTSLDPHGYASALIMAPP